MRYDAEWLLECLLLQIKNKSCYEHLRTKKILPLPHKDTLRRLISGMSCHFGFNSMALEAIRKMLNECSMKLNHSESIDLNEAHLLVKI